MTIVAQGAKQMESQEARGQMGRREHAAISHSQGRGEADLLHGGRVHSRQGPWRRGLSPASPHKSG